MVGHSFGGKIATLLEPQLLVLLSSAGIVMPKPLAVRSKIALYKLFKPLGIARLRSYFVAEDAKTLSKQMYETFKNVVDEDFSPIFAAFENKALICWGDSDTATPPQAGMRIASLMADAKYIEYEGDHYFFLSHAPKIASQIERRFLETLEHR